MGAYGIVAVGTDGSESSLRAVDRAAGVAAESGGTLIIICAYRGHQHGALSDDPQVVGSSPAEETLQKARERAQRRGAADIDTVAVEGDAVESIGQIVVDRRADVVVVGNRGLNGIAGRLLGSVPQGVMRRSTTDVLIVHTT